MTRQDRLCGVITPLLTPFERDLSIAQQLYHQHAAECLENGAHYLSPFGTTGEAAGHSAAERMAALEALVVSGAARPDQLMPGTGVCSLSETLTLTRHAVAVGCRAVMVLPPFFHVNATDDGLYRYFGQLIEGVGSDALRLCLYHIPQMARIGISPELAGRLSVAFPGVVAAYKDSSGDWQQYAGGDPGRAGGFGVSRLRERYGAGDAAGRRRLYLCRVQLECGGDPGGV